MNTLEGIANVREIDADDAIKFCYANDWAADGLPVVPPESARVDLFIALLVTMSPSASSFPSRLPARTASLSCRSGILIEYLQRGVLFRLASAYTSRD